MDRNLEALNRAPQTSWSRFGLAITGSGLIMVVASLLISTYPTVGYRAGYAAAIAKGPQWVEDEVNAADGTALRACDHLHIQTATILETEYSEFVNGCSAGVDEMYGRHVPVIGDR